MANSVSLDDLNHDPSLIDTLTDRQLIKLAKESSNPDIPLAGSIRSDLNSRAAVISTTDSEDED